MLDDRFIHHLRQLVGADSFDEWAQDPLNSEDWQVSLGET